MKTTYLTKLILKVLMLINVAMTLLFWFYCISDNNFNQHELVNSFAFIGVDKIKVIITMLCLAHLLVSSIIYEFVIVQFDQADTLKEILKELKTSREAKRMDDMDSMKDDEKIDFSKVR